MKRILAFIIILMLLIPSAAVLTSSAPPEVNNTNANVSAYVNKLTGNKNELYVTVTDKFGTYTKMFLIDNNAEGTYTVGEYTVYVDTKGNTQIRQCYIVSYTPKFTKNLSILPSMTLYLTSGDRYKLIPVLSAAGITANDLVWESSNTDVAVVNQDGLITAIEGGMAVITLTIASMKIYSECTISVKGYSSGWLNRNKNYPFTENEFFSDWRTRDGYTFAPGEITIAEDGSIPQYGRFYIVSPDVAGPGQPIVIKAEVKAADGAGLSLGYNMFTGHGYHYLFRTTAYDGFNGSNGDTNILQFLNEYIAWSPAMPFVWIPGEWYWMMFEVSEADGVFRGKIWQGDEKDEPNDWMHVVTLASMGANSANFSKGQPGLSGRGSAMPAPGRYRNVTLMPVNLDPSQVSALISREARIVNTIYKTEDIVVADFDVSDILINGEKVDKTGGRDATEFIQTAIDACFSFGGGTVWLPAGKYRITKPIDVKAFVTLRGDWNQPDENGRVSGGDYGTLIIADVPSSASDTGGLFGLSTSSGCLGLTVWYPNQNLSSVTPYPFTFEITNGVMANVKNCTMLNSYKGIGITLNGEAYFVHEMATIHNVYGTVLSKGIEAYNASEVDVYQWVYLNNKYWAQSGAAYNAPGLAALNAYTKANTRGFIFGDLEWGQMTEIHADNYLYGIDIVAGKRVEAAINISFAEITNCTRAVNADFISGKFYSPVALVSQSVLQGDTSVFAAISSGAGTPELSLAGCIIAGPIEYGYYHGATEENAAGAVTIINDGQIPSELGHEAWVVKKPAKAKLFDVTKAPYNAKFTKQTANETYGIQAGLPTIDATAAIQQALNDAGANGGGVVYIPAGWYLVSGHLTVPAGVELRGSSSVANRDTHGLSFGTVLMASEGKNSATSETDTAFITLNGNGAGIRGLRVYYPGNTFWPEPYAYPYSIRGNGANLYVINIGLVNPYRGIDFWTNYCPDFFIRRVMAISINETIKIGAGTGKIEACLTNMTSLARTGYGPGWVNWWEDGVHNGSAFWGIFNAYTRQTQKLIYIDGAENVRLLDNFSYGANTSIHVESGSAVANSHGADGNVKGTCYVAGDGASLTVTNLMMYGNEVSKGNVLYFNTWNRFSHGEVNHMIYYYSDGVLVTPYLFIQNNATLPLSEIPAPPDKPGYLFLGWFTEDGTPLSTLRITGDVKAYARWGLADEINIISFYSEGALLFNLYVNVGTGLPAESIPPLPNRLGYIFDGWVTGDGTPFNGLDITGNMQVFAKWEPNFKITHAIKGTPNIDGEVDNIWLNANEIAVNLVNQTLIPSNTTTTGKAWTMWDENYYYVLIEVYKDNVYYNGFERESADSVDIGIDFINSKGIANVFPGGSNYAGCFRIGTNNSQISGHGNAYETLASGVIGKTVLTEFGYRAEIAIPWINGAPPQNMVISMEIQINVNETGAGRSGLVSWNSLECMGWHSSESHGEVWLVPAP